jgi:hypothetical protein
MMQHVKIRNCTTLEEINVVGEHAGSLDEFTEGANLNLACSFALGPLATNRER